MQGTNKDTLFHSKWSKPHNEGDLQESIQNTILSISTCNEQQICYV